MTKDTLIAVKGKLRSPAESFFGLFIIILNQSQKKISTANIIMSMTQDIYTFNLQDSWSDMDSRINRLRYENKFAQAITLDLQERYNELMSDSRFYSNLDGTISNNDLGSMQKIFYKIFKAYFKDLDVEVDFEKIEHKNQESMKKDNGSADEDSNVPQVPPGGKKLNISLVLSPTGGILVTNLEINDEIFVRVKPDGGPGTTYLQDHDLIKEGNITPVRAVVTAVQKTTQGTYVIVKLDKNIYGTVLEEERVLVKSTKNQDTEQVDQFGQRIQQGPGNAAPKSGQRQTLNDIPASPKVLWGGALLLAVLLGLFLYLVFGT